MQQINLPTELLRTFVTIIDLGSFTAAGKLLGRTQPAISLQMRRLEELLDHKLFANDGRSLVPTESGLSLAAYARQILHLNDVAVSSFVHTTKAGPLRIGLPTDFAVSVLQRSIASFLESNPEVDLEIKCDLSRPLLEELHANQIDFAIALIADDRDQYLIRAWEERPVWAAATEFEMNLKAPVPLVGHPEGCEYRDRMVRALKGGDIEWRIAYTSPNITGLQDAVLTGLGVSALTQATLVPGMKVLTEEDGFPRLQKIRVGMFYKHSRISRSGLALSDFLISKLDEATDEHFGPTPYPGTA